MTDLLTQNNYTWPSRYPTPFDHQRVTAEFLVHNPRAFVFNDIGTSKTLTSLWAADFLMSHGAVKKVLVCAPLSTLWTVWADEIFLNIPHRKYAVLHGSKEKRLQQLSEDVDFYIINHDGLKVIWHELEERKDINLVIIDESAKFRNARTDLWRAANSFCGYHTRRHLWCMTGAPMPGGPEDIWAQAKLINPDLVPRYFTRFRDEMMIKLSLYKWAPLKGWEKKCYAMLQPSIRFTRDECLDLPPLTMQSRMVEMSKPQAAAYNEMIATSRAMLKDGYISAVNEAAQRIKLMQISAGAVYDGDEFVHYLDCKPKLCMLKETIETSGNKIIVFVSFRHSIPLLRDYISELGLSVETVFGDTAVGKRRKVFADFQHGDLQVIVAHPRTMAHGLTLTASHTIAWWAPVDSFEDYDQANGRITRPSQLHKQTIVNLSCSETERKIYARLRRREKMQGLLLELIEEK